MNRLFTAARAAVYAAGFVLVWGWVAVRVRSWDARLPLTLPGWCRPAGILVATAGAMLALSCLAVFVRVGHGTAAPFDPPRRFVAVGPYRFVRNPMYIGGFLVLVGAGLAVRSTAMSGFGLVFLAVMHAFVVLYEEPSLHRRFGDDYARYRRSVRRWLPGAGADPSSAG